MKKNFPEFSPKVAAVHVCSVLFYNADWKKHKGNRLMNTFLIKVSFLNVFLCFAHGQM